MSANVHKSTSVNGHGRNGNGNGAGGYEELLVKRGERSGARVVIAVHSTALGPALGGCRMWAYDDPADAVSDALRLARAMTNKAAAAGLDLGGGKGAICAPPGALSEEARRAMLLDFADAVESLDGRYITAEDVGTGPADMVTIAERTDHVVGLPPERGGSGDPSPVTARGVEAAIRACARERFGTGDLSDLRVCVIGLGHVGSPLARRLAEDGAELVVTDIDDERLALARELGASWIPPGEAVGAECDVLAPCALGEVIDPETIGRLRCEIVCGSANNVLADDGMADELHRRGILYAPDFIANAGGLINVYGELHHLDDERIAELVDGIELAMARVLRTADRRAITPLAAAFEVAHERLAAPKARGSQSDLRHSVA